MALNDALFSSAKQDWETPQDLFDELNAEFGFTVDAAASDENAKCAKYYTDRDDGLSKNWGGQIVFCNPPYGRPISGWIRKCWQEGQKPGTVVVALVPARTDTKWFHNYIWHKAEIRFIKGRLKFGNAKNTAPFPSMIAIWRGAE